MKTKRTLKQAVRVWLAENSMTQQDLAAAIGVDRATFSRVLNGYRPATEEVGEKLMAVTGIDIGDFDKVAS